MSKLQEQVKFHVTQMTEMLARQEGTQEGTLSWYTRFSDHWRELLKLYPDPQWLAANLGGPEPPGVQQTPSPALPDPPPNPKPPAAPSGSVHYQVDLDILQGALVDLMIDDGYGKHTADMKSREAIALLKARGVFKQNEKANEKTN